MCDQLCVCGTLIAPLSRTQDTTSSIASVMIGFDTKKAHVLPRNRDAASPVSQQKAQLRSLSPQSDIASPRTRYREWQKYKTKNNKKSVMCSFVINQHQQGGATKCCVMHVVLLYDIFTVRLGNSPGQKRATQWKRRARGLREGWPRRRRRSSSERKRFFLPSDRGLDGMR